MPERNTGARIHPHPITIGTSGAEKVGHLTDGSPQTLRRIASGGRPISNYPAHSAVFNSIDPGDKYARLDLLILGFSIKAHIIRMVDWVL